MGNIIEDSLLILFQRVELNLVTLLSDLWACNIIEDSLLILFERKELNLITCPFLLFPSREFGQHAMPCYLKVDIHQPSKF